MADIAEEYRSSLSELNFNSKPHINMLTMLAEENSAHASVIVKTIVDHINSVTPDVKLPSLYLVDSIVKNIGRVYISLFSKHLVSLFTSVFEKVDENVRSLLYKLRSTWTGLFPNTVLLQLDRSIVCLDPAWPILAKPQIHFNPKFLTENTPVQLPPKEEPVLVPQNSLIKEVEMKKRELLLLQALHQKKKELITLQLKAALASPASADSVKDDTKKTVNARDPRLSKKMTAASSVSDSASLQSVVVVPKGNVNKRNEKESTTTTSKKVKLDSATSPKKDSKSKPNSVELEKSSKLNVELNTQNNTNKPVLTQKNGKNKKRSFDSENSSELLNKLPLQQNMDFTKDNSQSNVNSISRRSNELIKNNFVPKTSVTEENKYLFKPQPVMMTNEDNSHKNIQKLDPPPAPPLFLGNEDKDYRILPKNVNERSVNESAYPKRPAVPVVKSFILDKKERKVYFVNDRSFAFMDDNVPRELTFEGPPKLVFIEGLPQPIELAFGKGVKFDLDGKCNYLKFGTPSREVYINDYPYEAQFGGPPFTAMLSDGKIHRIRISGPSPHVILSESPAHELYENFCQNNKEFLQRFDKEPSINDDNVSSDVTVGTRDVDMRVNNMKFSSTFFNFPVERMQDVDWQRMHVDNVQRIEWNVPKNSFETFKNMSPDFVPPRNFSKGPEWANALPLPEMQNTVMNPPPLPPKEIINRFPCVPSLPPPHSFRNVDVNTPRIPINQFPMNERPRFLPPSSMEQPRFIHSNIEPPRFLPPNNVSFSQPSLNNSEFNVNRPDLNAVMNSNIPRLSPPPLPPFIGPVQSTNCLSTASNSAPYINSISSAPLHLPPVSAPLLNLPPLQPMPRLSAPLPVSTFSSTTQVPAYTVPENVPKFTAAPSSTVARPGVHTSDMQLFMEKLRAAGLIKGDVSTPTPTASESDKKEDKKEEPPKEEIIPEITFDSKCLKEYHSGIISAIYNGSQCATCGMRFKEIQSEQYSRHLDWHFRRNRREKDGAKKPFSRRWFYEIKDWIQFKELEDVDERAPSYFELQANSEQVEEVPENVCSVSCSECDSENCAVCGEQFQLFWIEEEEEWHLRNAVKHDDQVYHPACYEDFKKANEPINDAEMPFEDSTTDVEPSVDQKVVLDDKMETEVIDDASIKTEMMDMDVIVKTEKMDTDVIVKTEMMDVDAEIDKEHIVVDDSVTKKNKIVDIEEEKVDSNMKGTTKELKIEEKPVEGRLNSNNKNTQLTELNRITAVKSKKDISVQKEVKSKQQKTVGLKSQKVFKEEKVEKDASQKVFKEEKVEKDVSQKVLEKENNAKKESQKILEEENLMKEESQKVLEGEKVVIEESQKVLEREKVVIEESQKVLERENVVKEELQKVTEKENVVNEKSQEILESENDMKAEEMEVDPVAVEDAKESVNIKKELSEDDNTNNDNCKIDTTSLETNSDINITDSSKTNEKSESSSQSQNVPVPSEDDLEDVEFRPPTPDPRFEVLPPVSRGTELSNLCSIM